MIGIRGAMAGLAALLTVGTAQAQDAPAGDEATADFLREILAAVEGGEDAATLDPALADTVRGAAETAAGAIGADDADAAIAALEGAVEAVADARPFGVRRAVLVAEEVEAFGEARLRGSNTYAPEETVTLYVEPTGYDFAGEPGDYRVALSGDYALLSPSEQILLVGQADFARFDFEAEEKTQDLFLTISYTLRDLRPGTYTIVTRLNDLNGGDATSFRTPIVIGSAGAGAETGAPTEPVEGATEAPEPGEPETDRGASTPD